MSTWKYFTKRCVLIFLFTSVSLPLLSTYVSAIAVGVHAVSRQGQQIDLYEGYDALVIGVGDYKWWPKLPYARHDAEQVAEKLKMMGFRVQLVLDPTSQELKTALNKMVYTMGRDKDRAILLYYAGHGETETLADNTKMGYIVPIDCPLLKKDPLGFASLAVSMREIESISLRIRSKHVLMLFDSCFSGSLFSLVRAVPEDITEKSSLPVRQYITAGRDNETVPDKSMFKRTFLIGLEGDADLTGDGYITGSELGLYLADKVVNYTKGRQHPQYGKINNPNLDRGDFVIIPIKESKEDQPDHKRQKVAKGQSSQTNSTPKDSKKDENLEIVFWESIRQSNDCEMYREYLKQFPSGKFSGLAKIHIQNLKCGDFDGAVGSKKIPVETQTKVSPAPTKTVKQDNAGPVPKINSKIDVEKPKNEVHARTTPVPKERPDMDSRLKLAVFPMYFPAPTIGVEDAAVEISSQVLSASEVFKKLYSYYDVGEHVDSKNRDDKLFTDDVINDIWIKKSFFSDTQPNIVLITKMGNQLYVDVVLLYKFVIVTVRDYNLTIYLVDIKKEKLYKKTYLIENRSQRVDIKISFEDFLEGQSYQ
jgi:hypothetical protein